MSRSSEVRMGVTLAVGILLAVGMLGLTLAGQGPESVAPLEEPTALPGPELTDPASPAPYLPLMVLLILAPLVIILVIQFFVRGRGDSRAVLVATVLGLLLLAGAGAALFFVLAR
ncbi:MAG: hypothetical protein ACLFU8_08655 [Anaerolineales bacterium]